VKEEIKKLKRSVNLVDAKLKFMHEQFGELKELFQDVVQDVDALADVVGDRAATVMRKG
jgi:archaellum component FlaC